MRNKLIEELRETTYWNLLFKEDTQFAYFGGSELIGFRDEKSDYDIICITKNTPNKAEYDEYLMWNDKKVHFTYFDYKRFEEENIKGLGIMTLTQLQALKTNNTVFYNKNNDMLDELLNKSDEYLKIGYQKLAFFLSNLVNEILKNNCIKKKNKTKYLYHLVYAKRKYNKENIEEEYLKQLKRIRWQPIEQQYIDDCIRDLKDVKKQMNL